MAKYNYSLPLIDKIIHNLSISNYDDLEHDGLFKGKIGAAYYNYYLYKYINDETYAFRAISFVEEVINEINTPNSVLYSNPSLVTGLAGIGLCFNHFHDEGFLSEDLQDQLIVLDQYLQKFFYALLKENNTDFFNGAIGLFKYFANRYISNNDNGPLMDDIFSHLNQKFIRDDKGVRMSTNFGYLNRKGIDLSNAHGIISMYSILLKLYEVGYNKDILKDIVIRGIDFLLYVKKTYSNTTNDYSIFPNFIAEFPDDELSNAHHSHRLAWCNGDLSILWLIENAAVHFDDDRLRSIANNIKLNICSRKSFDITRIEYSYFCHGSSGVAQIYRRLYQITKDEIYKETYLYWIEKCKSQLEDDYKIGASFPYKSTLLFGWPGSILTLLNHETEEDFNWDQIFLLS